MNKRVAVILGGTSLEREISLKSGDAVYNSLKELGYDAYKVDPKMEGALKDLVTNKPDIAFVALHGMGGEDGTIQGLLRSFNIPYTGSSVEASALTMNKIYTQSLLKDNGFLIPPYVTLSKKEYQKVGIEGIYEKIEGSFGFPCMVKAPSQGSTLGIYFINKEDSSYKDQLQEGIEEAFKIEDTLLIEEMIVPNVEITIGVIGNEQAVSLPSLEITTTSGYYDYESKYTEGKCDHIIPARLPLDVRKEARRLAEEAYELFGCSGFSRVDFMVRNNELYIIDINTIPGFTNMSLVPDAAKYAGISFNELVDFIIKMALGEEFPLLKYQEKLSEV